MYILIQQYSIEKHRGKANDHPTNKGEKMSARNVIIICLITLTSFAGVYAENEHWTYGEVQNAPPPGRICHTAIHDYAHDRMIIYAGARFGETLGDLWSLDPVTMEWTELIPENNGPYVLRSHCAVYNPDDTAMVIFGGVTYPGGYITDQLWILDLNTLLWEQIEPSGEWPPPTRCNYATYRWSAHEMVMFGGRWGGERYNTTWILDLETYTWRNLEYENTPPTPREGAPILILQDSPNMLVYGGYRPGPEYIDELWVLDLDTGIWTAYDPDPPHPIARGYCPLLYDKRNNRALLFSGFSAYEGPGLNDLWQIDLDSIQYTELIPTGQIPSSRGRFTTIIGNFADHRATIFGGAHDYEYYYDDVYFLDWDVLVSVDDPENIPDRFTVLSNYPNPFNASTSLRYILHEASELEITIYDIRGRKIETLLSVRQDAGLYQVVWNAENRPSAIYFYRIQAGDYKETKKMVLLK